MKTPLSLLIIMFFTTWTHEVAAADSDLAPMYVGSKAIKERFSSVTAEDMEMLRSKKIIFTSQSFGQNMRRGLLSAAIRPSP